MELINSAKDQQAVEANRNAALLLEEIRREKAVKELEGSGKVEKKKKKKGNKKTKDSQ